MPYLLPPPHPPAPKQVVCLPLPTFSLILHPPSHFPTHSPTPKTGGVRTHQVCVDTVEKMQGQERDLVIVCYGGLVELEEAGELDFAYSRERLNTAITRAKKKCVLVCSREVLEPTLAACETAERQTGFELLRRISAHCPQIAAHGCVRLRQGTSVAPAAIGDSQETTMSQSNGDPARRASQLSLAVASQTDDSDETDDDEGGGGVASPPPHRLASSLMPPPPAVAMHSSHPLLAASTEGGCSSGVARVVDSQETQVESMESPLVESMELPWVESLELTLVDHLLTDGGPDAEMTQLIGQGAHQDASGAERSRAHEAAPASDSTAGAPRPGNGPCPATPPHRTDQTHSRVPPRSPQRVPPSTHTAGASTSGQPLTVRPAPEEADVTPKKQKQRFLPPSMTPGGGRAAGRRLTR
jgi:hypothetical protein